ncbi:AAA family ATPase [Dictyobacter kobayashii]|uniref:Cell division protein FtsH n=1 Tax=Dictyobacter kobayashii TaxID=2014872 RepID=A0A402ABM1_9CHLR|nr:AAA family ATPase [Dictyobacter kobayashii]GCE16496.1 cell division protein FtsH [Dictyobacter kobayashii]
MSAQEPVDTKQFLSSFKDFMDQAVDQVKSDEPVFATYLRQHFETDPKELPVISEQFEKADQPNFHIGLTKLIELLEWETQLIGVIAPNEYMGLKIAYLLSNQRGAKAMEGPVEYSNVYLHDGSSLACIQTGLYLIKRDTYRLAILISSSRNPYGDINIRLEVVARQREEAENFLSDLRTAMRRHNVYRSHVISINTNNRRLLDVQFHHLPAITRDNIILPAGTLEHIERQTLRFAHLSERLKLAKRHIKRGLLLYGPPGTGKTLSAMYIAKQMPDRTVILVTGQNAGLIEKSCQMARLLQPATVIIEDVDLIAEERTSQNQACNALLFELLNQMDGISDDADILFLLTTNRPDILEPALAARPGRIDLAIEIPLPDRDCRRRLFELYSDGITLQLQDLDQILDQTKGVSATFIRELLRKAALISADENHEHMHIVIEDSHINAALRELIIEGGEITKQLLGAGHSH